MYACNCNQQSVQENISKKIIVIKLFTAILVGRINCVCTLAPVDTILWKFFSKRGYKATKNDTDEISHIISLTKYNNGKLSRCQRSMRLYKFVHNGLFHVIEFKAFSNFLVTMQLYCCQALLFTY